MPRVPRGYSKLNKMAAKAAEKLLKASEQAKQEKAAEARQAYAQRMSADGSIILEPADGAGGGPGDPEVRTRSWMWDAEGTAPDNVSPPLPSASLVIIRIPLQKWKILWYFLICHVINCPQKIQLIYLQLKMHFRQ